jgi:DNA gyrase subunit A
MLLLHSGALQAKTTKDNGGVAVMTQKKGQRLVDISIYQEGTFIKPHRYRTRTLPALGSMLSQDDEPSEQLSLI